MNNFDTFQREAKAALRVALQWFFLAVPTGLVCGLVGTLVHLSVECVTELRHDVRKSRGRHLHVNRYESMAAFETAEKPRSHKC